MQVGVIWCVSEKSVQNPNLRNAKTANAVCTLYRTPAPIARAVSVHVYNDRLSDISAVHQTEPMSIPNREPNALPDTEPKQQSRNMSATLHSTIATKVPLGSRSRLIAIRIKSRLVAGVG